MIPLTSPQIPASSTTFRMKPARALLKNAPITIAHHLATIEQADQILVVDGGRIAQKGTHKELIKQEGKYRDFIKVREQAEG